MSTIAIATIFLNRDYGYLEMCTIEELLLELADEVKPTRKSRLWHIIKDDMSYDVDVTETDSRLYELEDELVELGLSSENVPETIIIVSNNISSAADKNLQFVDKITNQIIDKLGGVTNGGRLSS